MPSSDFKQRNKMLKKDQIYNWFDKYEMPSNRETYILNQVTKKACTQSHTIKRYRLAYFKRRLIWALRA